MRKISNSCPLKETRGIWIASVDNLDWPSKPDLTEEENRQEIIYLLDIIEELNFNTIYLQVKPAWGVMYQSDLEPTSSFLSKDKPLNYDPLIPWIEESRKRGIFIHAWTNPYRIKPSKNPYDVRKPWYKKLPYPKESLAWMDPSYAESREQLLETLKEIMKKYPFDGIHMDDYFYPYKAYLKNEKGVLEEYPDEQEYKSYQEEGGTLSRDDWRRNNVDLMIESINNWLSLEDPNCIFGVSPYGIWKKAPAYNLGVEGGVESFSELYDNAPLWSRNHWIDYVNPQLYWSLNREKLAFRNLVNWWQDNLDPKTAFIPGIQVPVLNSGRDVPEEEIWHTNRILRNSNSQGVVFFRIGSLKTNEKAKKFTKDVFSSYALPSQMPLKPIPETPSFSFKDNTLFFNNGDPSYRVRLQFKKGTLEENYLGVWNQEIVLPKDITKEESLKISFISSSGNESFCYCLSPKP